MSTPQTASALGLMVGFPPAPDKIATHANQLYAPYNRWSFQNELTLNCTVDVWRGASPVAALPTALRDLSPITYQNRAGQRFTFDDMVEASYTDGIVVLHQGAVIYERYRNGMQPHTLHAWASGSKSMTGVMAVLLAHEEYFALDNLVTDYLPELQGSGFADATIHQVMEMTTGVGFREAAHDPVSENYEYSVALGWRARAADDQGAENVYEFLPLMPKVTEHGERFAYLTPNTDVLAWLIKRTTGQTLAAVMQARIWSKLGAERDAFWIVGPAAVETAGSGLLTTVRDMARFGQMVLQQGEFHGQQIVPAPVVEEIERGGDQAAFARGPAAGPGNQGWSYHQQWWMTHNNHGAYLALGYGGQILYIDPVAQLVVAKVSSFPTPTAAGEEFYSAFVALPALGQWLVEG